MDYIPFFDEGIMTTGIRLIAEHYEIDSNKIISSKTIIEDLVPFTFKNLL
jgi:hypothetical protein